MVNRNENLKKLVISAVMIALGTVLSLFKFGGLWAFGGGVTFCAMLPLVVISYIYGCKFGTIVAFIFSVLQLILGVDNIQYATNFTMAVSIVLFDYIAAYSVIGLSGFFKNRVKNQNVALIFGISITFFLRFLCHFFIGWVVWDSLWPNEFGMLSSVYSFCYNISYMLPETVITSVFAVIIYNFSVRISKNKNFKGRI